MIDRVKITFVLPPNLQSELRLQMSKDGYDLKGKSRWVVEAIEELLSNENFAELVKINDVMHGFTKLESIILAKSLKRQLDAAIIQVRRIYPDIEGVQSRILRTAIMQRLIRQGGAFC